MSDKNNENSRFSENVAELVVLNSTLDPREINKYFGIEDISNLVDKYYSHDFEDHDKICLKRQLQHYVNDVIRLPEFKILLTIF